MSKRGVEFRDTWIEENICADTFLDEKGDQRAEQFAEELVSKAEKQGIKRSELEFELTEDLSEYINNAMAIAEMQEVQRLVDKDD